MYRPNHEHSLRPSNKCPIANLMPDSREKSIFPVRRGTIRTDKHVSHLSSLWGTMNIPLTEFLCLMCTHLHFFSWKTEHYRIYKW